MKKILFKIALMAIVSAGLLGCASQKFQVIDKPINIGDKSYTAIFAERTSPWHGNAVTVSLVESQRGNPNLTQVQQQQVQPNELLTQTHVVNNNNQGSTGWVNGAFQGAVGDAIMSGGMMGAAALIRPSRVSANGGSGGQSSAMSAGGAGGSASSSAASSAASSASAIRP